MTKSEYQKHTQALESIANLKPKLAKLLNSKQTIPFMLNILDVMGDIDNVSQSTINKSKLKGTSTTLLNENNIGRTVIDRKTGFTGTLSAVCYYANGRTLGEIQPSCKNSSVLPESEWFEISKIADWRQHNGI